MSARPGQPPAPHEVIVIGAGHNGLAAAALLARHGRRVLVVERRDVVGGLAASEEFHPGYRSAGLLHDTTGVWTSVVEELGLDRYGVRQRPRRPDVLALGPDRSGLLLAGDVEAAAREIAARSARDAERYVQYHACMDAIRHVPRAFLHEPPPDLFDVGSMVSWETLRRVLRVRRLGRRQMMELLRLPPMSVADWLGEWFETEQLMAALALPAIAGAWMGPRSPGSNANLLLWEAAAGPGTAGGAHLLVAALAGVARELGVELRTGAQVERILLDSNAAAGVVLADGEALHAPVVAASCDPKQVLLDLLPRGSIPYRLEHRILKYRARGTTAQVLLALNAPLGFACRPGETVELARTGGDLNALERAFDAVKYRRVSETPILDIHVPTVSSPELAPAGHSVVSVLVHFAPHELEGGWDDAERRRLGERVVAILEEHAPGVSSTIVAREVLTPVDIEARYGVSGGHIHHGEHSLDQLLVRPTPECARYATPIPGLFLCGSGSHPGGGLTCAPGALAAAAILGG